MRACLLLLCASLLAASAVSGARAQTTIGFETDCGGGPTPNNFDLLGYKQVSSNLYAACGVAEIISSGDLGTQQLHDPILGDVDGQTGDVVLSGALVLGNNVALGLGNLRIRFTDPVNEVSVDALSIEDGQQVVLEAFAAGEVSVATDTFTGNGGDNEERLTVISGTPIVRVEIRYEPTGIFDGWFVDQLTFQAYVCGDGVTDPGEQCDDGNTEDCVGDCSSDCQADQTVTDGCYLPGSGTCVERNSADDGNTCRLCLPDTSRTGFTVLPENAACDDGLFCTDGDLCNATGGCVPGPARDCGDGQQCTADSCNEDTDACDNPALDAGTACDDGLFCTDGDACDGGGACVAGPARPCGDGLDCTTDTCDEAGDACVSTVDAGNCAVDGACFAATALNPTNPCLVCDPSSADRGWSEVSTGTACEDGDFCTVDTVCNGSGSCVGEARSCDDLLDCTVDACDEDGDACVHTLAAGCLIDGVCRNAGADNPDNPCQACDTNNSREAWSAHPQGTACGSPSCVGGVLTPAAQCDGDAGCSPQPEQTCDGAVCADEQSCTGQCTDDAECLQENFCDAGAMACEPDLPGGADCERDAQCESGFCTDGVCCDARCEEVCESCTAATRGVCTRYEVGTDPEDDCDSVLVCGQRGECVTPDLPDGQPCGSGEECESGVCADGVCCDQACDGSCQACTLDNQVGVCAPYPLDTDPEQECAQACNGAGACVEYEVRGNGLCSASAGRPSGAGALWLGGLLLVGLLRLRRRI